MRVRFTWDPIRNGGGSIRRSESRCGRKVFHRVRWRAALSSHRDDPEAGCAPGRVRRPKRTEWLTMKQASTTTNSPKRLKISEKARAAYGKRDRGIDSDPDSPQLPPDYWSNAVIGKYYRPLKTQISFRIENEVLDWLKSKSHGHLSRINEILRERMTRER